MTTTADYVLGPSPADWDELQRELAVDPVTFEIVRHKLEAINQEQAIALKEVSVSPIVTRRERLQQRPLHGGRPHRVDGPAGRLPQRLDADRPPVRQGALRRRHQRRRHVRGQRPVLRRGPPSRHLARRADLPRRPAARLGGRRCAPGRHGRHEHRLDLGPGAGEGAGGADDAADEADRPRAAAARRVAADPEHDPPAADRRARPPRVHRLEQRRAPSGCASSPIATERTR